MYHGGVQYQTPRDRNTQNVLYLLVHRGDLHKQYDRLVNRPKKWMKAARIVSKLSPSDLREIELRGRSEVRYCLLL